MTASLDVNRKILLSGLVKRDFDGSENSPKSWGINADKAVFRAVCTRKRVALCATLWCGKQDNPPFTGVYSPVVSYLLVFQQGWINLPDYQPR